MDTGAPLTTTPAPKKKGKWKITAVLFLLVLPLAAFALWVTVALNFSYADGERAGFVQKLSRKGWVCKTWEGEMALANGPNVMPEIFRFSVRDDKVAQQIYDAAGKQVKVAYSQHKGVPTQCFGETEYYVKSIQLIGASAPLPAPVIPGAIVVPPVTVPPVTLPPAAVPSATVPPATTLPTP